MVVLIQDGQHLLKIICADRSLMEVSGLDLPQSDGGGEDKAQQPHAAKRSPEEIRILVATAGYNFTAGEQDGHRINTVAEAPLGMVSLTVDIVRDAPGDGHKLGSLETNRVERRSR